MATEEEVKSYEETSYLELLSIKIRQGYLTEADKKEIERVVKVILNAPIEEVSKHWFQLTGKTGEKVRAIIPAVHAYPGVAIKLGKALLLELEAGKLKPYISPKCPCRPALEQSKEIK